MAEPKSVSWTTIGALLGGLAAIAGIHATLVVPAILDAASVRARVIAQEEASSVRELLLRHLDDVESIRSTLATKSELDQLGARIALLSAQLDRIEQRLAR